MTRNRKDGPAVAQNKDAPMPHDSRVQPPDPKDDAQHAPIRQAHADVESGIVDTERTGIPNEVPSSAKNGKR